MASNKDAAARLMLSLGLQEEESDDDVMSTVTAGKPGKGVGSTNAPAIELMERIKLKVSGQEHKHGMGEKFSAKETGKKNKIPARKDK
jgi:biotin carboxylase